MLGEPYDGLIVGSLLTLFISTITICLTKYFDERHSMKQNERDSRNQLIEELYSPLYFYLYKLVKPIGYLGGFFFAQFQKKSFTKDERERIIRTIEFRQKEMDIAFFTKLLHNKFGLIKPSDFQADLFDAYLLLEKLVNTLQSIDESAFDNNELLVKKLNNYSIFMHYYNKLLSYFEFFLKNEVFNEKTDLTKIKYTRFLNSSNFSDISSLLDNPNNGELNALVEKRLAELDKETERLCKGA